MINKNKKKYDIHERIFRFIIRVINLTKQLPKNQQNLVIISQILDSVTSMGANDQEADGALTRRDFIHCYTVVRKEGKETNFWLRLIQAINPGFASRMVDLIKEGEEIVAIVSQIIANARKKSLKKK
ncbi:MAG: four helix bundle protein [Patescibacteria group bacterium]